MLAKRHCITGHLKMSKCMLIIIKMQWVIIVIVYDIPKEGCGHILAHLIVPCAVVFSSLSGLRLLNLMQRDY